MKRQGIAGRVAGLGTTIFTEFSALAAECINILMITTSEIKISVLVSKDQGLAALRTLPSRSRKAAPDQLITPRRRAGWWVG